MLVTCPSCAARYRLAADRLPPQGARLRCPKCEHVFAPGQAALPPAAGAAAAPRPASAAAAIPSAPPPSTAADRPPSSAAAPPAAIRGAPISGDVPFPAAQASPAVLAARIRLARRAQGERPMLVSHGFGLGAGAPADDPASASGTPSDAMLALTAGDVRAIAEDLVMAVAANHAERVAQARADQRWDAHLGPVIREVWSDFQACVGNEPAGDEHFRAALNRILAGGRPVF